MWETYKDYCKAMKKLKAEPLSEEIWKREYRISTAEEAPLMIRPKHNSSISAHCKVVNQIRENRAKARRKAKEGEQKKPKAVKIPKEPKPRYKPPKIYTDEEIKARRAERLKAKREAYKAMGLTINGTPRIIKEKKILSDEEKRERRRRYAKNYREKHREKHLAYRKSVRERLRESQEKYRENNREAMRERQRLYKEKKREDPSYLEMERQRCRDYRQRKKLSNG